MRYTTFATGEDGWGVFRMEDGEAVSHQGLPEKIARQVCELANEADVDLAVVPLHPHSACAYIDPDAYTRAVRSYHDALSANAVIIVRLADEAKRKIA